MHVCFHDTAGHKGRSPPVIPFSRGQSLSILFFLVLVFECWFAPQDFGAELSRRYEKDDRRLFATLSMGGCSLFFFSPVRISTPSQGRHHVQVRLFRSGLCGNYAYSLFLFCF
jgi:hypothetical protein